MTQSHMERTADVAAPAVPKSSKLCSNSNSLLILAHVYMFRGITVNFVICLVIISKYQTGILSRVSVGRLTGCCRYLRHLQQMQDGLLDSVRFRGEFISDGVALDMPGRIYGLMSWKVVQA